MKIAAGGFAAITLLPFAASATPQEVQKKIDEITNGKKPAEGKISITLPEIAENGGTVPLSIQVESPMSESDHVKAIHILADGNPLPWLASHYLGPHNGRADVSMRIRLRKTQKVAALVEMSNGEFFISRREVKVTIGGCG